MFLFIKKNVNFKKKIWICFYLLGKIVFLRRKCRSVFYLLRKNEI